MTELTYEYLSPLIKKLDAMPEGEQWYNLSKREDREQFTEVIQQMIDIKLPYEFSEGRISFRKFKKQ